MGQICRCFVCVSHTHLLAWGDRSWLGLLPLDLCLTLPRTARHGQHQLHERVCDIKDRREGVKERRRGR